MLQSCVDDHLVADQISMPATEEVELIAIADQFDTDRQMRIGNFRAVLPDRFVIAEAVMGILRDGGYINVAQDGGITLTEAGLEVAERTYERHTVLSDLFMRLGIDEEHAVNDACKIEHVISAETFEALKKHLKEYS